MHISFSILFLNLFRYYMGYYESGYWSEAETRPDSVIRDTDNVYLLIN